MRIVIKVFVSDVHAQREIHFWGSVVWEAVLVFALEKYGIIGIVMAFQNLVTTLLGAFKLVIWFHRIDPGTNYTGHQFVVGSIAPRQGNVPQFSGSDLSGCARNDDVVRRYIIVFCDISPINLDQPAQESRDSLVIGFFW